jgi:hypothetical protein
MSYSSLLPTFPLNVSILQNARWFTPEALQAVLKHMRALLYPIVQARETGFDVLSSIFESTPFSIYPNPVRFQSPGIFATEADVLLARILNQLARSLQFKDRLEQQNTGRALNVPLTSMSPAYLAAWGSFNSALLALTNYTNTSTNYFTRDSFEALYGLTWS